MIRPCLIRWQPTHQSAPLSSLLQLQCWFHLRPLAQLPLAGKPPQPLGLASSFTLHIPIKKKKSQRPPLLTAPTHLCNWAIHCALFHYFPPPPCTSMIYSVFYAKTASYSSHLGGGTFLRSKLYVTLSFIPRCLSKCSMNFCSGDELCCIHSKGNISPDDRQEYITSELVWKILNNCIQLRASSFVQDFDHHVFCGFICLLWILFSVPMVFSLEALL